MHGLSEALHHLTTLRQATITTDWLLLQTMVGNTITITSTQTSSLCHSDGHCDTQPLSARYRAQTAQCRKLAASHGSDETLCPQNTAQMKLPVHKISTSAAQIGLTKVQFDFEGSWV